MLQMKSIRTLLFVGLLFIFIMSYTVLLFSTVLCYATLNSNSCIDMSKYVKIFIELANVLKK
jgi:hypothetical protein